MKQLPTEIIRQILDDLPPSSLKAIRLCWPFLEPFILPRLFHTIKINFAERNIKRLRSIALSPHLAPLVQQLIWITRGTRDTHDDCWGQINTWTGHEVYIKKFCQHFFSSVDAMPNLHTFASELGPPDLDPERDEIDGLVYALWPAMCRPESRITSFRCQDPLTYMKWLHYECLQAQGGQLTAFPTPFPARALLNVVTVFNGDDPGVPILPEYRRSLRSLASIESPLQEPPPMPWEKPLGKLLRLDLRTDLAGNHWRTSDSAEAMVRYFLTDAVNIRELSVRFRPTGIFRTPTTESKWMLTVFLACRWKFLHTIKIKFASLFSPRFFINFMENHAKTLKHILLHQCPSNDSIVEIIRGAAMVKELKLHRFLIFPSYEGRFAAKEPRILPERLVLDFINNKDPSLDPFYEWVPGNRNWGTVTQRAASVSEEWPDDDGMHFTCRQCVDQV